MAHEEITSSKRKRSNTAKSTQTVTSAEARLTDDKKTTRIHKKQKTSPAKPGAHESNESLPNDPSDDKKPDLQTVGVSTASKIAVDATELTEFGVLPQRQSPSPPNVDPPYPSSHKTASVAGLEGDNISPVETTEPGPSEPPHQTIVNLDELTTPNESPESLHQVRMTHLFFIEPQIHPSEVDGIPPASFEAVPSEQTQDHAATPPGESAQLNDGLLSAGARLAGAGSGQETFSTSDIGDQQIDSQVGSDLVVGMDTVYNVPLTDPRTPTEDEDESNIHLEGGFPSSRLDNAQRAIDEFDRVVS